MLASFVKSKQGFSLVELIVAIVLLAVAMISALAYIIYTKDFAVKAENYAQATQLAVRVLETLNAYNYTTSRELSDQAIENPHDGGTTPLNPQRTGFVFPDCPLKANFGGSWSYTVAPEAVWSASPPYNGCLYKKITVTITWNDGAPKTMMLSGIRGKT